MPIVSVELIAPAPAPAPAPTATTTRALLEACSAAVHDGRCALSTEPASERLVAIATVVWTDTSERRVRVEVRSLEPGAAGSRARSLDFNASDERIEKWRTVGLTIATLVGDMSATGPAGDGANGNGADGNAAPNAQGQPPEPGSANGVAPPRTAPPSPAPAPLERSDERHPLSRIAPPDHAALPRGKAQPHAFWVGLSGLAGPGLEDGPWRLGAGLDAGFRAPTRLPIFGRLSFSYAERALDARGLSVQWETFTLGGGVTLGTPQLRAEPRVAFGVENVHAQASDQSTNRKDSGNQVVVSAHAAVDFVFQPSSVALVGSVEGFGAHAPTRIVVDGQEAGVSAAFGFMFGLGGRFFFE